MVKFTRKSMFSLLLAAGTAMFFMAGCGQSTSAVSDIPSSIVEAGLYTPGTYTAAAAGMNGDVEVAVTVDANTILAVEILSQNETESIATPALTQLPEDIVTAGSTDVEGVAGATVTSNAIKEAVSLALLMAAGEEIVQTDTGLAFSNPDVIVIGAGFAGMNAALEAANAGAKVYLIEKNNAIGGSIRYAGGTLSGAGTRMQADAGVVDTPANFYADIERMGGGYNIPELTWMHVNNSAAAVDWLDELGADFGDRQPTMSSTYDAFDIPHEHRVSGGGAAMVEVVRPLLEAQIEAGNIALLLETEVADIILENGAVTGVVINDDAATKYYAPSIVLATGGYGHNKEMIQEYNFTNVLTDAPEFVTGDGYAFALKAGAQLSNMDYLPAYAGGVPVADSGFVRSLAASTVAYEGAIWVNLAGERFMDEYDNLDSEKKSAWASAQDNIVFVLLTQEMRDTQEPLLKSGFSTIDENWARFDEEVEKGEVIFRANTIEELAALAGINPETLVNTVDTYNTVCKGATADEFGRTGSLLSFAEGPYYAVKTYPYVMLTKGGPLMNAAAQVLDESGQPIAGLFECGELAGGANIGGAANIGGLANTSCIVWGKIAGSNAAEYALTGSVTVVNPIPDDA